MLPRVVDPISRVVNMLTTLSKIDIEAFGSPVADGSVAVSRQLEVHFNAFTTAWVTLLDAGSEDGGAVSQARRLVITTELQKMTADLSSYVKEHYNTLTHKEAAVRRWVIYAASRVFRFVREIEGMARRKYPSSPLSKLRVGRQIHHGSRCCENSSVVIAPAYSGGCSPGSTFPAPAAAPGRRTQIGRWSRVRCPTTTTDAPTHHGGLCRP